MYNANGKICVNYASFSTCTGDAMEIEDEDSNSNSNIYISAPMAAASSHTHSTHIPHRPSLLSQFPQAVRFCLCLFAQLSIFLQIELALERFSIEFR